MTSLLMRPLRQLVQALVASDSPRQIAAGLSLGMMIGLLPKGNLVVVLLTMLLCGLRINKPAGLMAVGIFSWVGIWLDSTAHQLGALLLTWQPLIEFHAWLNELPLGPWLALNNTVVLGQLLIGLYLLYPTYHFSHRIVSKYQPRLSKLLMRYRLVRWVQGAELGTHWSTEG